MIKKIGILFFTFNLQYPLLYTRHAPGPVQHRLEALQGGPGDLRDWPCYRVTLPPDPVLVPHERDPHSPGPDWVHGGLHLFLPPRVHRHGDQAVGCEVRGL